jgi:hypothetical protein
MTWISNVAWTREKKDACRILVGKPERNRPIERTRCGLEDKNVS